MRHQNPEGLFYYHIPRSIVCENVGSSNVVVIRSAVLDINTGSRAIKDITISDIHLADAGIAIQYIYHAIRSAGVSV